MSEGAPEKALKFLKWYSELMGKEEGLIVEISPFILGVLTALMPAWWLHVLISALFIAYQSIEIWVRIKLGLNGESTAKMLKDIRGFVAGYILGLLSKYLSVSI